SVHSRRRGAPPHLHPGPRRPEGPAPPLRAAGGRAYDAAPPGPRRSARRIGRVDRLGPTGDGRSTLFDPTVWEPNDHQAREAPKMPVSTTPVWRRIASAAAAGSWIGSRGERSRTSFSLSVMNGRPSGPTRRRTR